METEYRAARSSEQVRVAEDLHELYSTAGVLVVDAEGHGIISANIASTVHDTFHALCLPNSITGEKRLRSWLRGSICGWHSPSPLVMPWGDARKESAQEIATMLTAKFALMAIFDS